MGIRLTHDTLRVMQIFLDDVERRRYGMELMRALGWPSGKLYPILRKLDSSGWLDSDMEDINTSEAGRPARRWYRIAPDMVDQARAQLDQARTELEPGHVEGQPS